MAADRRQVSTRALIVLVLALAAALVITVVVGLLITRIGSMDPIAVPSASVTP